MDNLICISHIKDFFIVRTELEISSLSDVTLRISLLSDLTLTISLLFDFTLRSALLSDLTLQIALLSHLTLMISYCLISQMISPWFYHIEECLIFRFHIKDFQISHEEIHDCRIPHKWFPYNLITWMNASYSGFILRIKILSDLTLKMITRTLKQITHPHTDVLLIASWLTSLLFAKLTYWLKCFWYTYSLIDWLADCLIDWLTG